MSDVFEPRNEPAKSIYLAFQAEATKRKARQVEEWVKAERAAVHRECLHQAQKLGFYTIGSAGHESNALVALALRAVPEAPVVVVASWWAAR